MRELQLWETDEGLDGTFDEIAVLAAGCHFADCRHDTEPRCAVKAAVEEGRLPAGRLAAYHKLQAERAALAARKDVLARDATRRKWRVIHRAVRRMPPKGESG
jgi:ribosome biogenesis GTPase